MSLHRFGLAERLHQQKVQQLWRQPPVIGQGVTPFLTTGAERFLNFSSNDYLGLAGHPYVAEALQASLPQAGAGASAQVTGHFELHRQLEIALARQSGYDEALLFGSGYLANLAIQQALCGRQDIIVQDRLNHASLIDGARLSGARLRRYRHLDMTHLQQLLTEAQHGQRQLVVSDQIFSMDGDEAPAVQLALLCQRYGAALMLDDAHGFGWRPSPVTGIDFYMATLGKAIGVYGAFVAGCTESISYLRQFARPHIYTTALPPALASACLASLAVIAAEPWRQLRLYRHIERVQQQLRIQGWPVLSSATPIQPVLTGLASTALELMQALRELGIWVTAIRPPTVPVHASRLRITLSAAHEDVHIDQLLDAMARLRPRFAHLLAGEGKSCS